MVIGDVGYKFNKPLDYNIAKVLNLCNEQAGELVAWLVAIPVASYVLRFFAWSTLHI